MKLSAEFIKLLSGYLRSQAAGLAVVTDANSQTELVNLLAGASLQESFPVYTLESKDLWEAKGTRWLIVSQVDENQLFAEFEARAAAAGKRSEFTILGFIPDVLVPHLSKDWPPAAKVHPDAHIIDLPSYAICCTPRSGSTYLAEMLESAGLGIPNEHLRDDIIAILADLDLNASDSRSLLKAFFWRNQQNFVFGTKLISHYMITAEKSLHFHPEVSSLVLNNFKIIYLVRRDKVRQAVSDFLANNVGVWHVRNAEQATAFDARVRKIDYDFVDILNRYNTIVKDEQRLFSAVKACTFKTFYYEDMLEDPQREFQSIVSFLGFTEVPQPHAKVLRQDSDVNQAMTSRFLADYEKVFGIALKPYSAESMGSTASRPETAPQSFRDLKNIVFGQYQKRSWQIVDYKCKWSPTVKEYLRADQRQPGGNDRFLVAIGAAQTFAPYVTRGYLNIVSDNLQIPAINYGIGGAGPDFFTRPDVWPKMLEECNRSAAVVFQVMSCRTMGSSVLPKGADPKNSLVMAGSGKPIQYDAERALVELRRLGRDDDLRSHIEMVRRSWVEAMRSFSENVRVPKILFWFGRRTPDYVEDWSGSPGTAGILGEFPQLITRQMINEVSPMFDKYVEVIFEGPPERLVSRFTGHDTLALFGGTLRKDQNWSGVDDYYPNTQTHGLAGAAITDAVRRVLNK